MTAESKEQLIAEIVATLKVDPERGMEVTRTVRFRLEAKLSLLRFYEEMLPAGAQKRKASALSRALKKVKSLSRDIEPLFSAMFYESVNHDPSQSYMKYASLLDQGIMVADELRTNIIVSKGKKPRDIGKFQAKALATELVGEFSPVTDKREDLTSHIATLAYEFLTGRKDADLSEPPDAYAPFPIRTRRG